MADPICAVGCDEVNLPVVDFDECNPQVNFSEIEKIFIARSDAAPFTNVGDIAEWNTRLSQTATGPDAIRELTVIGDKPAAVPVIVQISNGREASPGTDHTINADIDDVSGANYEFMRALECGGVFKIWYLTAGGFLFGGNNGIKTKNLRFQHVLNRGREAVEILTGVITWRAKFHPERVASPFPVDGGGAPITFNTTFLFASSTSAAGGGVSGTVTAVDPDQKFEFNAQGTPTGTPIDMNIEVGGVLELVIAGPGSYAGQPFRYTSKAGTVHTGVFTDGTVDF